MSQLKVKVVFPQGGRVNEVPGGTDITILRGTDTGGLFAIGQQINEPGSGPPLHCHRREDETFFIIEGEYEFLIGGRFLRLPTGCTVFGPRGVPHTFRSVGPGRGRIQVTITPAGFEQMFDELGALAEFGPPDPEQFVAVAKKYGVDILGPPSWPGG
jgi:mannose-6-phosphate isomerase-like protein (cupin superfamily)